MPKKDLVTYMAHILQKSIRSTMKAKFTIYQVTTVLKAAKQIHKLLYNYNCNVSTIKFLGRI